MKFLYCTMLLLLVALTGSGQYFTNSSFEVWGSSTTCEINTPPDGWMNYSNVGVGPDEANFPLCPTTIPSSAASGSIYARCLSGNPNTGEGMYQIVHNFRIGNPYTISYRFCGSNRWGGSGDCVWHLFIDDIDVNQSIVFSSSDTIWHTNAYSFIATQLSHKIGVRAYTPTFNGGGSAAIDLFTLEGSSTTDIESSLNASAFFVGPNPFENNLNIRKISNLEEAEFILFDVTGQMVLKELISNEMTINTSMLSPAVYFYQLRSNSKMIQQGRIIKR